jgi:hypothetical protein
MGERPVRAADEHHCLPGLDRVAVHQRVDDEVRRLVPSPLPRRAPGELRLEQANPFIEAGDDAVVLGEELHRHHRVDAGVRHRRRRPQEVAVGQPPVGNARVELEEACRESGERAAERPYARVGERGRGGSHGGHRGHRGRRHRKFGTGAVPARGTGGVRPAVTTRRLSR